MPKQLVAALGDGIFRDIENRSVVGGPGKTVHALDLFRHQFAGLQVLYLQRVLPVARVVGRVGQQIAVVAGLKRADRHELLSLGQFVHIEKNLFGRFEIAVLPAKDRILQTFFGARVVKIIAPAVRHIHVSLLYVAENFVVKLCLQRLGRLHHRVGVSILGFKMRDDRGICFFAQPEIIVHQPVAINLGDFRLLFSDRRLQHG